MFELTKRLFKLYLMYFTILGNFSSLLSRH